MEFKSIRIEQYFQGPKILFYSLMWHWLALTLSVETLKKRKKKVARMICVREACCHVAWKDSSHIGQFSKPPGKYVW